MRILDGDLKLWRGTLDLAQVAAPWALGLVLVGLGVLIRLSRHAMRTRRWSVLLPVVLGLALAAPAWAACPYDPNCLSNPYGAGSPYKADGLMNPYSRYGNPYSNQSWTNPYATDAPKLYDDTGTYRGQLSTNPNAPDSVSNPYGRYGNQYSPDSINNPYGAGNPYSGRKIYVVPSR